MADQKNNTTMAVRVRVCVRMFARKLRALEYPHWH